MPDPVNRVLVLGGTREAVDLTRLLASQSDLECIYSLAGVTSSPNLPPVTVRKGGFGGFQGLRNYLAEEAINLVTDATHPYSVSMTSHAVQACAELKIPYVRLERSPWLEKPGDQWRTFPDGATLASALPTGAKVFLTVGQKELHPYMMRRDIEFVARMIETPSVNWPDNVKILQARPERTAADEQDILERIGAEILVAKNSGGKLSYPKIEAARRLQVPVYFIERPRKEDALTFNQVEDLANFVSDKLASQG